MRRSPIKRRSNSKRSLSQKNIYQALRAWVTSPQVCQHCKRTPDGSLDRFLECHHILTVGSTPELRCCWVNLICLCHRCHRWAHENIVDFRHWLDGFKPGLFDHLRSIKREWVNRPLDEVAREASEAMELPWAERWESLEVAS